MTDFQPITVIAGRDPLPTPALDKFAAVAADCRRISAIDAACEAIRSLNKGHADIHDVLMVLRALEEVCDGETSCALQECREAVEGDLPQPEHEPYPIDFSGERKGR